MTDGMDVFDRAVRKKDPEFIRTPTFQLLLDQMSLPGLDLPDECAAAVLPRSAALFRIEAIDAYHSSDRYKASLPLTAKPNSCMREPLCFRR